MSSYTLRHYKGHKLEKEGSGLKPYCVKISALSGLPIVGTNELSNNYLEKYKTPFYETTTEAFTHAYGWVDCTFCNQTDPIQKEDSCKQAYKELREEEDEFYSLKSLRIPEEEPREVSDEQKETLEKQKEAWEKKLEKAYKKGWGIEVI